MDTESIWREAVLAIDTAYGSRLEPRFNFVSAKHARHAYAAVLRELSHRFEVLDTTDENDDVSLVLALKRDRKTYTLYLSMVGRFATMLDSEHAKLRFIDEEAARTDEDMAYVAEVLRTSEVRLLNSELLRQSVDLRLPDESRTTLFRALFSAVDPDLPR